MTLAMVWPWASPVTRVRRIIMSSVPFSMSLLVCFELPKSSLHSNFYGNDNTPLGVLWEDGFVGDKSSREFPSAFSLEERDRRRLVTRGYADSRRSELPGEQLSLIRLGLYSHET